MRARTSLVACALALFGVWLSYSGLSQPAPALAAQKTADKPPATPMPVDATMHDLMDGMFKGSYRRLKAAMVAEPKENPGWSVIRSEALLLAEGGNLLLLRKPAKDTDEWVKYSVASRDAGAELYKAAKAKDFTASKKAYETMLTHCNACHKKFDEHDHQLKP
jgi:hypothetical protein